MSDLYERAPERGEGLRLHLNENTAGCSPRVLAAMRAVTAGQAAFYPDYASATRALAAWVGVAENQVLLTNGLDEGIYVAAIAWLRQGDPGGEQAEAVVVEPAYALFAASAGVAGGHVVHVPPRADFAFPLEETLAAITPRTRLLFLASPANPTGMLVPLDATRAIARALPSGAVLFLDEAYVEFASESFLPELPACPNVLLGRTFAKAYGLAAVRAGYLVGAPPLVDKVRSVIPPFSVNVFALAAVQAATAGDGHAAWYVDQVRESRRRIVAMCARLGLECWPSEANFVLVRVGTDAPQLVGALAERKIFVRDRSRMAGCEGCIRITAGVVEHTDACLAALEDLCAGA